MRVSGSIAIHWHGRLVPNFGRATSSSSVKNTGVVQVATSGLSHFRCEKGQGPHAHEIPSNGECHVGEALGSQGEQGITHWTFRECVWSAILASEREIGGSYVAMVWKRLEEGTRKGSMDVSRIVLKVGRQTPEMGP